MRSLLKQNALLPSLLLAAALSAGLPLAIIVSGSLVSTFLFRPASPQIYKHLTYTIDGQVFLEWNTHSISEYGYRKLDGVPIADDVELKVSRANASSLYPPQFDQRPASKSVQIVGFLENTPPRNYWFLVQGAPSNKSAYFVGYHPRSKQVIGYIGKGGFQTNRPAISDQFPVSRNILTSQDWAPSIGSTSGLPRETSDKWDKLYLVSDGDLYAINLEKQTVEPVPMPERVVSVGTYEAITAVADERQATYHPRLVVRLADKFLIMTPEGEMLRTIPLTPAMQSAAITVRGTTSDELILTRQFPDDYYSPQVIEWLNPANEITRHEQVALNERPEPDPAVAWGYVTLAPSPLPLWISSFTLAKEHRANHREPDFATAYARIVSVSWPPFMTLVLLSLGLAIYTYRRHRALGLPGAASWATFVLLFGPPGIAGYLLHRRWPARASCGHCGQDVPRDRTACLACATEFPSPALTGVEIFA